jgi:UDP-N-acetylmuramoylalanine--D-glutamate ligase
MKEVEDFAKTLNGNPVAVFGLARSGLSTIRALQKAGVKIIAWDDNEKSRAEAKKLGAEIQELNESNLKSCAFLVLAPGVPLHFPEPHVVVQAATKAGIEIICDIELFNRLNHGRKTVGVTGTNGKSTTTALIHHILKSAGVDAVMGGNIGLPVFDLPVPGKDGVFVLELSSYQLDLCPTFRPDIAVLLNITPDHLDRHGTMENYAATKEKIFEGPGGAVIGGDDEYCRKIQARVKEKNERTVTAFSVKETFLQRAMQDSLLKGQHNYQNALAAFLACKALNVSEAEIIKGLKSFPGLPHRQFPVRTMNGVLYINDSKATNSVAAARALHSYDNIYWIVGGRAKEGGLSGLEPLMKRVRKCFLIGESADNFSAWMTKNKIAFSLSKTLDVALREAHSAAQKQKKGVVLLAPACASFDQFSSYEERGDVFTKLVNDLKESAAA